MLKKFLVKLIILTFFFNNFLISKDIPVIVIAPSKKAQSVSTVGTSVIILDEDFFRKTNEFFLGDPNVSRRGDGNPLVYLDVETQLTQFVIWFGLGILGNCCSLLHMESQRIL